MPTHRTALTCAVIEKKIYVIGGNQRPLGGELDYTGLKVIEMYDTVSDTAWVRLQDMPTGRWGATAIAVDGKIYVIGGTTGLANPVYSSIEVYDPNTDSWSTKASMPTARYQLTTCLLDDKIYAIGGWRNSSTGPIYDKVEVYDPVNDAWKTENPMPVTRSLLASIAIDDTIIVYGGSRTTHPLLGTSAIYKFEQTLAIEEDLLTIPKIFDLEQNYPNPFNPVSTIQYEIPHASEVSLIVYDILGREVTRLVDGYMEPGYHQTQWDGRNVNGQELPSGIYIARLVTPEYTKSIKMVLLR